VNVAVGRLDVPDHRAIRNSVLAAADSGDDVPVAELGSVGTGDQDRRRVQCVDGDRPAERGVHRRPIGRRDIDAEVELPRLAVARDPRVTEVPTDRVLPVEGFDRPAVREAGGRRGGLDVSCGLGLRSRAGERNGCGGKRQSADRRSD
jgi:hypothetical protein